MAPLDYSLYCVLGLGETLALSFTWRLHGLNRTV